MSKTLENKTAIVTGGSRGIGAAIAGKLGEMGANVVVNYASKVAQAEEVVEQIKKAGAKAIAIKADVSKSDEVKKLFDETIKNFSGVDIIVNNAGILSPKLPTVADTDDETFDSIFDINVKGTFLVLREAAKVLRNGGRIINLSSSVIPMRREGYSIYSASKAAVEAITAVMSKEMRGREITVNAVAPGPTATELFMEGKSEELVSMFKKLSPLERLGTPEDIASAVAFLASPEGGWVNGQVLRVNGGTV